MRDERGEYVEKTGRFDHLMQVRIEPQGATAKPSLDLNRGEPDEDYVFQWNGSVWSYRYGDQDRIYSSHEIASVELWSMRGDLACDLAPDDIIECADATNQDIYETAEMFFRSRTTGTRWCLKHIGWTPTQVYRLRHLKVHPDFRGQDIGRRLVVRMIHNLVQSGTGSVVVVKAVPLVRAERNPLACGRLRKLYEGLGFERVGQTDWMLLNTEYQQTVPASWTFAPREFLRHPPASVCSTARKTKGAAR